MRCATILMAAPLTEHKVDSTQTNFELFTTAVLLYLVDTNQPRRTSRQSKMTVRAHFRNAVLQ